jgi:malonate-semialdehyde dehydrogenase (acetylating)/methylmalonate-semialdehyde dehydrogenase
MQTLAHWLAGKPWDGRGTRTADVFDPARGAVPARVRLASAGDVDEVVSAAARAFPAWRDTPAPRRARVLFAFRDLLEREQDAIAACITAEHGKVTGDAKAEVARGREVVDFACGVPALLAGASSPEVAAGVDVRSLRQPLGVVAGITPFNFPAMVPLWMFPLAIACGNTFVLKPSERDPSASLLLAELLARAGLPEGVFNVVQGDREAVDALLCHPDVAAISFVGSTPVARHVYATAAAHGKRVQALGGAKNHMVVLPDADLDAAADAAVAAGYGSAGERCMAVSVVVAVEPAADALVQRIAARARALRVGDGRDPASDMGPLVTREHRDRVKAYVDRGVAEGASLVVDGRDLVVAGAPAGFFLGPCLFDAVGEEMSIYRDEIFGPVLCVVRAASYADALALVNRSPYGNGAALFTRDGAAARHFERAVEAGMVGINVAIPVPVAFHSFGGFRQSLFGDTHVYGREGIHFYTRGKVVTERWGGPRGHGPDLRIPSGDN